ncbi:putative secreted protein [Granulibacter bethesdensis]|uniref:Secreted protein n=2 Tax=Granulibacter bethesdensis TaxID=364410 RepID=A0AAC9P7L2_9PROT|nr:putative secreted protein [Granulibacter bethesdensis]APH61179.1 putative secreted protein [Granulibacter bethesdensis]
MQDVLTRALVILVIVGMLAQMALMALSRPGEVPRAALERLTGLLLTDPVNVPTYASSEEGDCVDASHEADMSVTVPHELMAQMHHGGHDQRDHDQPGHDQHQACSICVFLAMAAALLVMPVLPPLSSGIWVRIIRRVMQPRAPPGSVWLSAYARGPPVPV